MINRKKEDKSKWVINGSSLNQTFKLFLKCFAIKVEFQNPIYYRYFPLISQTMANDH